MNRTAVERIILVAVLIVLYAVGIFFIRSDYKEDINGTHRNALVTMGHEYAAVIQGISNLSGIFFEEEIAKDPVTSIMSSAWQTSTGQERAGYRALLYKNLTPLYEKLGLYRFSQLHFHFPDTTSFLRFNRPQRFGDRLDTQQESVRIANLEKRAVSGFEADRVSGTYRFVHPLFHHGEHVGSVEFGASFGAIMDNLTELFNKPYQLMLSKEQIDGHVFPEERANFIECWLSDEFVLTKSINPLCILEDLKQADSQSTLPRTIRQKLAERDGFAVSTVRKGETFLLVFIPVRNLKNEFVAYLLSEEPKPGLVAIQRDFIFSTVLISVILILLVFMMLYVTHAKAKLHAMAIHDRLTGIYNRQMFREVFNKELSGRVRYKRALSLIMFDIDHFKHVNDTHGHATGDYVLKEVCSLVRQNLRASDYFVRWGGEEFLILLTDTDRESACKVAESLRSKIASHNFERAGSVTCSFGVCEIGDGTGSMDQVIERADELLYKAKAQGRNRVES